MSSKLNNVKVDLSSGPAERALKKFKRMCDSFGILREYKKRKEYLKPCEAKKEKRKEAQRRKDKAARTGFKGPRI